MVYDMTGQFFDTNMAPIPWTNCKKKDNFTEFSLFEAYRRSEKLDLTKKNEYCSYNQRNQIT